MSFGKRAAIIAAVIGLVASLFFVGEQTLTPTVDLADPDDHTLVVVHAIDGKTHTAFDNQLTGLTKDDDGTTTFHRDRRWVPLWHYNAKSKGRVVIDEVIVVGSNQPGQTDESTPANFGPVANGLLRALEVCNQNPKNECDVILVAYEWCQDPDDQCSNHYLSLKVDLQERGYNLFNIPVDQGQGLTQLHVKDSSQIGLVTTPQNLADHFDELAKGQQVYRQGHPFASIFHLKRVLSSG